MSTAPPDKPERITRFVSIDGAERANGSRYDFLVKLTPSSTFDPAGVHVIEVVSVTLPIFTNPAPRQLYVRLLYGPAVGSSVSRNVRFAGETSAVTYSALDNIVAELTLNIDDDQTVFKLWRNDRTKTLPTNAMFSGVLDTLAVQLIDSSGAVQQEEETLIGTTSEGTGLYGDLQVVMQITTTYRPPVQNVLNKAAQPDMLTRPLYQMGDEETRGNVGLYYLDKRYPSSTQSSRFAPY